MGFMDKAKEAAKQAQKKLDEVQQNFNEGGSTPGQGDGTRYDDHGRPVQDGPPAADAPPPSGEPTAPPPAPEPPTAQGGDANDTPDPFRPIQQ